jgi:hypothetical protein
MAVSGVAMSSAVFLAGGGAWSLDSLIGRSGWAKRSSWAAWVFSGPLPSSATRTLALLLAAVAVVFTVGSYHILFGAVVSQQHARVSFHRHAIALSEVTVAADGAVIFDAYVEAGPDTGAAYFIAARLGDRRRMGWANSCGFAGNFYPQCLPLCLGLAFQDRDNQLQRADRPAGDDHTAPAQDCRRRRAARTGARSYRRDDVAREDESGTVTKAAVLSVRRVPRGTL